MRYNAQYDQELKELYHTHHTAASKILSSKKYKYLHDYVIACTSMFTDINLATRVWHTIHHNTTQVRCCTCGKILTNANIKFKDAKTFRDAFVKFCSPRCGQISSETKQKLKQTNLQKYGVEWTFQSSNNKIKSRQTMLQKYGVEHAQQSKKIKEKSYSTMIEKYGVKHPLHYDKFKQNAKNTTRKNQYKKFVQNKYVEPLFTEEDYIENGDCKSYKWRCRKCGSVFCSFKNEVWFKEGAVKSYARCEKCYPYDLNGTSVDENDLADFLAKHVVVLHNTTQNRQIIPPLELDIYVPSKKIAVEYDGIYWHSESSYINKTYHLNKTLACEEKGIQLIHVFENEWKLKQDIVKSRLKDILGIYDKTVYARKCIIKEVDNETSRIFQEKNHLQGAVNAKINLGLYFNGELISLMTFGKCRFDKKHDWEMLRFCSKLGYHIVGGAGKLLKHFEKTYQPKSLVSYADRRWSQGKLYKALGFKLDHISAPNYWYWKSLQLESRQKYQKHFLKEKLKIFDSTKSEVQNMRDNGYNRIFDCGNLVFVKTYAYNIEAYN